MCIRCTASKVQKVQILRSVLTCANNLREHVEHDDKNRRRQRKYSSENWLPVQNAWLCLDKLPVASYFIDTYTFIVLHGPCGSRGAELHDKKEEVKSRMSDAFILRLI